jgi:hypothetical protein
MASWQIAQEKKSARMIGNRQMSRKSSCGGHSGKEESPRRPRSKIEVLSNHPPLLFASNHVAYKNLCMVPLELFSVAKLADPTY